VPSGEWEPGKARWAAPFRPAHPEKGHPALFAGLLEEERIRDDHHAAALRLGELPGAHAAGHARLQLRVARRGLRHRRRGDRTVRRDDELHRHLAAQLREAVEEALEAVANLSAVSVDDLAD